MIRPKFTTYTRLQIIYQRQIPSRAVKEAVWDMTKGRCWYCGYSTNPFYDFVVEHIVPLCRGGSNGLDNLVPSCAACNTMKGRMLLHEWRETNECKANVLDHWDGSGRFWFEIPHDEDRAVEREVRQWREWTKDVHRGMHISAHGN